MKDRVPTYPGRIKLVPVSGQENTYDMERADSPIQEGTPLNRHTLLSDETIAMIGLTEDATPDDALRAFNDKIAEAEQTITEGLANGAKTAWGSFLIPANTKPNTAKEEEVELVFDFAPQFLIVFDASVKYEVLMFHSFTEKGAYLSQTSSSNFSAKMGFKAFYSTPSKNKISFYVDAEVYKTRTLVYIAIG